MKTRVLLTVASACVATTQLLAVAPPSPVPDSGGTVGALALGLLVVVALRRRLNK